MAGLLADIGRIVLELLARRSVDIRPDRTGKRDQWVGLAVLLVLLGGIGFVVAMILSL